MLQTAAELIINKARYEMKQFIRYEVMMLQKILYGAYPSSDEDYVIYGNDLAQHPGINVCVDNSYLDIDDNAYENREVSEIVVTNDAKLDIFFRTEQGDELTIENITIEELGAICDALQATVAKKAK